MVIRGATAEEGLDWGMITAGMTIISAALSVFGIGKKIERGG